ncbi:hypothetical protein [Streptomyces sp. NPDC055140]
MARAPGVGLGAHGLAVRAVKLGERLGGRRKSVGVLGQPYSGLLQLRADRVAGLVLGAVVALPLDLELEAARAVGLQQPVYGVAVVVELAQHAEHFEIEVIRSGPGEDGTGPLADCLGGLDGAGDLGAGPAGEFGDPRLLHALADRTEQGVGLLQLGQATTVGVVVLDELVDEVLTGLAQGGVEHVRGDLDRVLLLLGLLGGPGGEAAPVSHLQLVRVLAEREDHDGDLHAVGGDGLEELLVEVEFLTHVALVDADLAEPQGDLLHRCGCRGVAHGVLLVRSVGVEQFAAY